MPACRGWGVPQRGSNRSTRLRGFRERSHRCIPPGRPGSAPDEWQLARIIRILTLLNAGPRARGDGVRLDHGRRGVCGPARCCSWAPPPGDSGRVAHIADKGASWVASRLVVVSLTAMVGLTCCSSRAPRARSRWRPSWRSCSRCPTSRTPSMGRLGFGCWLHLHRHRHHGGGCAGLGWRPGQSRWPRALLNTAVIAALAAVPAVGLPGAAAGRPAGTWPGSSACRATSPTRSIRSTWRSVLARHLQESTHADAVRHLGIPAGEWRGAGVRLLAHRVAGQDDRAIPASRSTR